MKRFVVVVRRRGDGSQRRGRDTRNGARHHVPANWGPYKTDLLQQAVRLAGLDPDIVTLISEPEAAVRHYASHERVEPGSVVAVYDLGGGTFDAALLRKTDTGFESLGRPEGIERLGGIDFDAAVLGHVMRALDGTVEALDPDEPGVRAALARLRQECVEAKEALSSDTETSIPVLLPNVQTEVRLTRAEFESMIRPSLADSLDALRRALSSADTSTDDVSAVLLVGGSSRVPLVAQLVSNEFGRPIAIDADPKHAVALGAAVVASAAADNDAPGSSAGGAAVAAAAGGATIGAAASTATTDGAESPGAPAADIPTATTPAIDPATTTVTPAADAPTTPVTTVAPSVPSDPVPPPGDLAANASERAPRSRLPLILGIAAAVVALAVTGVVVLSGSGGGDPTEADAAPTATDDAATGTASAGTDTASTAAPSPTEAPAATNAATEPPVVTEAPASTVDISALPTPCPTDQPFTACITAIEVDAAGGLVATYVTNGYSPELEPVGDHIHFFFDSVIAGNEANAGTHRRSG
ncbi:MAG: Hsp70 family protein [Actinomycetota bacterium]